MKEVPQQQASHSCSNSPSPAGLYEQEQRPPRNSNSTKSSDQQQQHEQFELAAAIDASPHLLKPGTLFQMSGLIERDKIFLRNKLGRDAFQLIEHLQRWIQAFAAMHFEDDDVGRLNGALKQYEDDIAVLRKKDEVLTQTAVDLTRATAKALPNSFKLEPLARRASPAANGSLCATSSSSSSTCVREHRVYASRGSAYQQGGSPVSRSIASGSLATRPTKPVFCASAASIPTAHTEAGETTSAGLDRGTSSNYDRPSSGNTAACRGASDDPPELPGHLDPRGVEDDTEAEGGSKSGNGGSSSDKSAIMKPAFAITPAMSTCSTHVPGSTLTYYSSASPLSEASFRSSNAAMNPGGGSVVGGTMAPNSDQPHASHAQQGGRSCERPASAAPSLYNSLPGESPHTRGGMDYGRTKTGAFHQRDFLTRPGGHCQQAGSSSKTTNLQMNARKETSPTSSSLLSQQTNPRLGSSRTRASILASQNKAPAMPAPAANGRPSSSKETVHAFGSTFRPRQSGQPPPRGETSKHRSPEAGARPRTSNATIHQKRSMVLAPSGSSSTTSTYGGSALSAGTACGTTTGAPLLYSNHQQYQTTRNTTAVATRASGAGLAGYPFGNVGSCPQHEQQDVVSGNGRSVSTLAAPFSRARPGSSRVGASYASPPGTRQRTRPRTVVEGGQRPASGFAIQRGVTTTTPAYGSGNQQMGTSASNFGLASNFSGGTSNAVAGSTIPHSKSTLANGAATIPATGLHHGSAVPSAGTGVGHSRRCAQTHVQRGAASTSPGPAMGSSIGGARGANTVIGHHGNPSVGSFGSASLGKQQHERHVVAKADGASRIGSGDSSVVSNSRKGGALLPSSSGTAGPYGMLRAASEKVISGAAWTCKAGVATGGGAHGGVTKLASILSASSSSLAGARGREDVDGSGGTIATSCTAVKNVMSSSSPGEERLQARDADGEKCDSRAGGISKLLASSSTATTAASANSTTRAKTNRYLKQDQHAQDSNKENEYPCHTQDSQLQQNQHGNNCSSAGTSTATSSTANLVSRLRHISPPAAQLLPKLRKSGNTAEHQQETTTSCLRLSSTSTVSNMVAHPQKQNPHLSSSRKNLLTGDSTSTNGRLGHDQVLGTAGAGTSTHRQIAATSNGGSVTASNASSSRSSLRRYTSPDQGTGMQPHLSRASKRRERPAAIREETGLEMKANALDHDEHEQRAPPGTTSNNATNFNAFAGPGNGLSQQEMVAGATAVVTTVVKSGFVSGTSGTSKLLIQPQEVLDIPAEPDRLSYLRTGDGANKKQALPFFGATFQQRSSVTAANNHRTTEAASHGQNILDDAFVCNIIEDVTGGDSRLDNAHGLSSTVSSATSVTGDRFIISSLDDYVPSDEEIIPFEALEGRYLEDSVLVQLRECAELIVSSTAAVDHQPPAPPDPTQGANAFEGPITSSFHPIPR
ncbi:unnamed protein product [Amoebophrya sp. A25]|nr:unnamed protein product [Amoebophrya sp. A25]|eukprot:GSA25T00016204001.1